MQSVRLTISEGDIHPRVADFKSMLRRSPDINCLIISGWMYDSGQRTLTSRIGSYLKGGVRFRELHLLDVSITESAWRELGVLAPQILVLDGVIVRSKDEVVFREVLRKVRRLSLNNYHGLSLRPIIRCLGRQLLDLNIDFRDGEIMEEFFHHASDHLTNLVRLELRGRNRDIPPIYLPNLRELRVKHGDWMWGGGFGKNALIFLNSVLRGSPQLHTMLLDKTWCDADALNLMLGKLATSQVKTLHLSVDDQFRPDYPLLGRIPSLRSLEIDIHGEIRRDFPSCLKGSNLDALKVRGHHLDPAVFLDQLEEALPLLRVLNLTFRDYPYGHNFANKILRLRLPLQSMDFQRYGGNRRLQDAVCDRRMLIHLLSCRTIPRLGKNALVSVLPLETFAQTIIQTLGLHIWVVPFRYQEQYWYWENQLAL